MQQEDDEDTSATVKTSQHIPCSISYKLTSHLPGYEDEQVTCKFGPNCIEEFMDDLDRIYERVEPDLSMNKPMEDIDNATKQRLASNPNCVICSQPLGNVKHLDHDHYTGKVLGYAHPACNMERQTPSYIPIFFHNLKGYDSHMIINSLAKRIENPWNIRVIPKSMEAYTAIMTDKFRFIDSYAHLNSSLDKLVSNLRSSGPSAFEPLHSYLRHQYGSVDPTKLSLLLRKGVYPYSHFTSFDTFNETQLPPRSAFYNDLNDEPCSDEDYAHVQNVWREFDLKTLEDLCRLYVSSDVLLLDCVLQQYRKECLSSYSLDPVHYYTSPALTWDSGLKHTKVHLQLLENEEMYTFLEQSIRGGISTIIHRFAKANNIHLPDFDPIQKSSFLAYIDANNLYGWAMRQKLPINGFKWLKKPLTREEILNWDPQSSKGYFLDVDVHVEPEDHDRTSDFPLFPNSIVVDDSMISYSTKEAMRRRGVHNCAAQKKLAPNLFPQKRYKVHIAALQLYLQLGGVLDKVHRVLEFNQKAWLKEYIDFNTAKRQQATSEFGKSFYKLLNNAFFGKSMESVRKRINVKLIQNGKQHLFQTSKPGFKRFAMFSEDLVGVEMCTPYIVLDKPIYLGAAILDLSKVLMYRFWYQTLKVKYDNVKLCFTDTDSFLFWVETPDFYKDIESMKDQFDTSNYPRHHYLFSLDNKAVPGLFKDECGGKVISEFVGLRSKLYSVKINDDLESHKMAAAGVKRSIAKRNLMHEDYKRVLFGGEEVNVQQTTLRSFNHTMFTVRQDKCALSAIDTKRFILHDCVTTRALGHHLNEYEPDFDIGMF